MQAGISQAHSPDAVGRFRPLGLDEAEFFPILFSVEVAITKLF